jgi:hypothetical protein
MKCLRNRSALTSFTLLLLVQMVAASCASDSVENTMSCEAAFYEAVDAGSVVSVNGLAIEADFSAFFVTELLDGHARIVTRQCMGDDFAIAVPVFPPNEFQDYQPTLSLDGERLCFTSTRPITGNIAVRQNVWCATRASQWQDAAPITALISPFWDGHAIEVEPLTLLYASERANDGQMVDIFRYDPATKDIDIYLSFRTERGWSTPVKPPSLASPDWDMSPAFTPDGKYLLYKLGHEPFRRVLGSEIISSSVR